MTTVIEIGGPGFGFCAAHAGLHGGQFEPLHGHTFALTVRLRGDPGPDGMLADFSGIKAAMAAVITPLKRRTLMPGSAPGLRHWQEDGQMFVEGGARRYSLPADDVLVLAVPNTTTEAIAAYLADQLRPHLRGWPGVRAAEVTLAEAPDTAATVIIDLAGGTVNGDAGS